MRKVWALTLRKSIQILQISKYCLLLNQNGQLHSVLSSDLNINIFLYNSAFARVFLARCQIGIFAASYGVESRLYGNCILFCVFDALYASDGVGMPLAYALAPESVVFAFGKDCVCVHSVKREKSGVPTYGDNGDFARRLCRLVYGGEVFGDFGVGVETVDDVEHFCVFWRLFGQVCSATAADYHNVYFAESVGDFFHAFDFRRFR